MNVVSKSKNDYKKIKWYFGKEIEIPTEWEITKFAKKIKLKYGTRLTKDQRDNIDKPVYGSGGIIGFHSQPIVKGIGVIIARKGSIGNIFYEKNNFFPIDTVYYVTKNETILNLLFLFYYLQNMKLENLAIVTSKPGINRKEIYSLKIFLPILLEQQKIASILSNVDALIESTQKIIEKAERLKKGLMQQLLTRGIGHTKFKKIKRIFGKYEEIPKEWKIKNFEDVFEFLRTGTNSRRDLGNGNIKYIHYGDIHTKWDTILDCDSDIISHIDKTKVINLSLLMEGDLIIADASEDHEGSGASVLLKNVKNKKIVSGLHTIALRGNKDISIDFRAYLTTIKFIKIQIIAYVTGISVYGLSKKNLKKIQIPIPTIQEQQKIASILSGIDAYTNAIIRTILNRLYMKLVISLLLSTSTTYYEFHHAKKDIYGIHNKGSYRRPIHWPVR